MMTPNEGGRREGERVIGAPSYVKMKLMLFIKHRASLITRIASPFIRVSRQ